MRNLAGIAAMMALSGGYGQGDRSWDAPTSKKDRWVHEKVKSKKTLKRRAANKKASQQRKSK